MLTRGLEDQLLASVVGAEQPELEKTKNDLVQVQEHAPSTPHFPTWDDFIPFASLNYFAALLLVVYPKHESNMWREKNIAHRMCALSTYYSIFGRRKMMKEKTRTKRARNVAKIIDELAFV